MLRSDSETLGLGGAPLGLSFECRERKVLHAQNAQARWIDPNLIPKGHKKANCGPRLNCPEKLDRICAVCDAYGSSKSRYRSDRSFECPEHTRSKFMQRRAESKTAEIIAHEPCCVLGQRRVTTTFLLLAIDVCFLACSELFADQCFADLCYVAAPCGRRRR